MAESTINDAGRQRAFRGRNVSTVAGLTRYVIEQGSRQKDSPLPLQSTGSVSLRPASSLADYFNFATS